MGKDRAIVSPPLTFDEFQNKAREIHSEEATHHEGIFYWDNTELYPNYGSIPNETKTQFVLNQAQNNDTLEQIQEHFEPLAFTSNSGSIKLRVWKLSEIKSIAKNGSADGSARIKKFEVWISSGGYDNIRTSIFDRLTSISGDSA